MRSAVRYSASRSERASASNASAWPPPVPTAALATSSLYRQRSGAPAYSRTLGVVPPSLRVRLRSIVRRLSRAYGTPPAPRRLPPLDELVLTILSQNTNDTNRDRAYADLRKRFPDWDDVADAPVGAIAHAVKKGGLAPTKAPRIKRSEEHTSELQSRLHLVCRLLLEKKKPRRGWACGSAIAPRRKRARFPLASGRARGGQ